MQLSTRLQAPSRRVAVPAAVHALSASRTVRPSIVCPAGSCVVSWPVSRPQQDGNYILLVLRLRAHLRLGPLLADQPTDGTSKGSTAGRTSTRLQRPHEPKEGITKCDPWRTMGQGITKCDPGERWGRGSQSVTPGERWGRGSQSVTPGERWGRGSQSVTPGERWGRGSQSVTPGERWCRGSQSVTPG